MSKLKSIKEDAEEGDQGESSNGVNIVSMAADDTDTEAAPVPDAESSSSSSSNRSSSSNQVWFQEEERWELTWPIWHMLPRHERKSLAIQHGFKTIGEFEEFMSLQREITDSSTDTVQQPYQMDYPFDLETAAAAAAQNQSQAKLKSSDDDDELQDDEKADDDSLTEETMQQKLDTDEEAATEKASSSEELVKKGGTILMLPDELLHRVFDWLPVDTYATLALVSPHWKQFTRTESVYKRLCERLYLNQSKRRALHVGRFENSYRIMLERRPRVRAGGGVYVMKYSKVKPIQRDMWTEIPRGAILEMVYYRYLYFQEDGRVLYALTSTPPHEMFPRFLRICLTQHHKKIVNQNVATDDASSTPPYEDPAAVWGKYSIQKTIVTVEAKQAWQDVKLVLSIQPQYQHHGRWGYLSFDQHLSSKTGDFNDWSVDRVVYEVPEEPFRFVRDKRL